MTRREHHEVRARRVLDRSAVLRILAAIPRAYKLPSFWWRYLRTPPFPECGSVKEVLDHARRHSIFGFNGQPVRAYILSRIYSRLGCTSFVETGTRLGFTTGYAAKIFGAPVFSCEADVTRYRLSQVHLLPVTGVAVAHASSPEFLARLCGTELLGSNPMFYLDAHWSVDCPLRDELEVIAQQQRRGVIVIDDFCVPWDDSFGYDEYDGESLDLALLDRAFHGGRSDLTVYLPAYDARLEKEGSPRGMAVVLMGYEGRKLDPDFPFDLLREVRRG